MGSPKLFAKAGSWSGRMIAGLLDLIVPAGLTVGLALLTDQFGELGPRYWNYFNYFVDIINTHVQTIGKLGLYFAAFYVIWETIFVAAIGNTPVAIFFGYRVVSGKGKRIGVLRAFFRAVFSLIFAGFFLIGPLWGLVSPRRRMLHDTISGCHVVVGAPKAAASSTPARERLGPFAAGPKLPGFGISGELGGDDAADESELTVRDAAYVAEDELTVRDAAYVAEDELTVRD